MSKNNQVAITAPEITEKGGTMPPPRRRPKHDTARPAMSVYPPPRTGIILGGYRSKPFTQAVRCWAQLFEPVAVEVEDLLSSKEWNFLAKALHGIEFDFDPEDAQPGRILRQKCEKAANFGVGAEFLKKNEALAFAEKVEGLSYLQAWACIWAVQWRIDFGPENMKPNEQWWLLSHRQQHLSSQD